MFNLYSLNKEEYLKIQNRISTFKEVTGTRSSIFTLPEAYFSTDGISRYYNLPDNIDKMGDDILYLLIRETGVER